MTEFVETAARELRRRADVEEPYAIPTMQTLSAAVSSCKGTILALCPSFLILIPSSVLDFEQRLHLLNLFRNKSTETETSSASEDDASEKALAQTEVDSVVPRTDLFEILADTHKLDPKTVRALTMDFLATLTASTGSHSPVSSPATPVHSLAELPVAEFSSQL